MQLNTLSPAKNSKKSPKRLGRGHTRGKTCGRGHKGYKSRSGSSVPASFEGGQTPLQRRLPKLGFVCKKSLEHQEVRLSEINAAVKNSQEKLTLVDIAYLKENNIISRATKTVKVFLSGEISKPIKLLLPATAGVKSAVEKSGGELTSQ